MTTLISDEKMIHLGGIVKQLGCNEWDYDEIRWVCYDIPSQFHALVTLIIG